MQKYIICGNMTWKLIFLLRGSHHDIQCFLLVSKQDLVICVVPVWRWFVIWVTLTSFHKTEGVLFFLEVNYQLIYNAVKIRSVDVTDIVAVWMWGVPTGSWIPGLNTWSPSSIRWCCLGRSWIPLEVEPSLMQLVSVGRLRGSLAWLHFLFFLCHWPADGMYQAGVLFLPTCILYHNSWIPQEPRANRNSPLSCFCQDSLSWQPKGKTKMPAS